MRHCHLAGEHPESVWFLGGAIEPYTVGRWAAYGPWTSDAEYVGTKEQCLKYANTRAAALEDVGSARDLRRSVPRAARVAREDRVIRKTLPKPRRLLRSLLILRKLNRARERWLAEGCPRGQDPSYLALWRWGVALEQNDADARLRADPRQLGLFVPREAHPPP